MEATLTPWQRLVRLLVAPVLIALNAKRSVCIIIHHAAGSPRLGCGLRGSF